jgi:hypothetical protein
MCLLMSLSERNPPSHALIALICKDKFLYNDEVTTSPRRPTTPRYATIRACHDATIRHPTRATDAARCLYEKGFVGPRRGDWARRGDNR